MRNRPTAGSIRRCCATGTCWRSSTSGTACCRSGLPRSWGGRARARDPRRSTASGEKRPQQRGGPHVLDPAVYLWRVVTGGRTEEGGAMLDRPALGVAGREIKTPDAGKGDRRCAHGAGLQGDGEVSILEPVRTERRPGLANHLQLGVDRG